MLYEQCICSEQPKGIVEGDIYDVDSNIHYCERDSTMEWETYGIW